MAGNAQRHKDYAAASMREPRVRLLGWPRILTFTLLIIAVMTLLYPRTALIDYVTHTRAADSLSDLYLRNLLKNEPHNPQLLLKRLDEMVAADRLVEADRLIAAMRPDADPADRVRLADYEIVLRERAAFMHSPGSAARERALHALWGALEQRAALPLATAQRQALAEKARAYGAHELAGRLYRELAVGAARGRRFGWLEQSAQAALARGAYEAASDVYFDARALDPDPAWQRRVFMAGVAALRASGRTDAALARAEQRLGPLADDPDVLVFMVRLAQAANRNDRAEVYIRKLLRFAELGVTGAAHEGARFSQVRMPRGDAYELSGRHPACDARTTFACWQRVASVARSDGATGLRRVSREPGLPFDDAIYSLGYEVFLANKNLPSAYAVAHAAVRQAPDNALWRERLARVAEWSGQPAHALEQWKYLALRHNSEAAWQAVLRLAPGLFDEQSVIQALMREYAVGRLDDARLLRLVQAFEAAGEASRGIEFLASAYQKTRRATLLEQQAWLEERLGRYSAASATLRRLGREHGFTPGLARRLGTLQIAQGYTAEAYRTLQELNDGAARRDPAYQTLLAELAWTLQDRRAALQTYRALDAQRPLEGYEAERLIMLMRSDSPSAAGRLAARLWDQHRDPRYLQLAVESYLLGRDLAAAQALLSSLPQETLESMSAQADFLVVRAAVHRQSGDLPEAVRLLQRARLGDPSNPTLAIELVWMLIEARDRDQLAPLLESIRPRAARDPNYWGAMGAGYRLLGRAREALPSYANQASAREDDYLWQIDYAQTLEAAGRADMAWRVRRHAWLHLRQAGRPDADQRAEWRSLATLALIMAPGDPGAQWLREWLRLDRNADDGSHSPEARELALAWYLSHEQHAAARVWLTQQYGRQLAAPGWAEAALALQANDKAALRRIAEGADADLPAETRVAAAMQLREYALARTLAKAGLEIAPTDDGLHLQLTDSVWQQQNRASAGFRRETLGGIRRQGWRTGAQWSARPALKMGLMLTADTVSKIDSGRLGNLPGRDRKILLSASLDHARGETTVTLTHREAWRRHTGAEVTHALRLDRRLSLVASAGYNLEASENDVLSVAGSKDTVRLGARWLISKRDFLIADVDASAYYAQDRERLGRGFGIDFQLGHRLRVEYPDLTVRLLASARRFEESGAIASPLQSLLPAGATLLPGSFAQYGLGFAIGESVSTQYSRSFRPYLSVDLLHSSGAGWGYGMEGGFVVSPTGRDWLRGRYRTGQNALGGAQDASLVDLEYRYLF